MVVFRCFHCESRGGSPLLKLAFGEFTDEHKVWVIANYFDYPNKAMAWVNQLRFQTLEMLRAPGV
jgi:hypothetical protein